jgi:hypothetical protein
MLDLYNNQYDLQTLKTNIYSVSLIDVLKTQKLTVEFCVKYILNRDFQLTEEEEKLTMSDIYKWQPHISKEELLNAYIKIQSLRFRVDSIYDFESYV